MLPAEVVAPPSLASVDILEHVICYGIHGYLVVRMRMCPVRTLEAHYSHYSTLFSPNLLLVKTKNCMTLLHIYIYGQTEVSSAAQSFCLFPLVADRESEAGAATGCACHALAFSLRHLKKQ